MTHDPVWVAAFLQDASIYRVALFYDLIPLQFPERYLRHANLRADYLVALAWLRQYDCFAAISRFSADGLIRQMNIDESKVFVSGVAVRGSLQPSDDEVPLPWSDRRWIVVSGGGDPRKNPECAMVAHARSKVLSQAGLKLAIFGNYPPEMRANFRALYLENGGSQENLIFQTHLSDSDLHQLYREGLVTVVPSRAEGFSIPIVEGNAAGTPILASDVGAHPELVRDAAWRFDPDDPAKLQNLLETLALNTSAWTLLQSAQSGLWRNYTVEKVGQNFIEGVLQRQPAAPSAPAIARGARPKLAVLTPLPPALSGVADYSAVTLRPLKAVADVYMFTTTPNAIWEDGWAGLSPVADLPYFAQRFDATISVLGNSGHHTQIFDYLLENGGACIAHDARQLDFYFHEKGIAKAADIASAEAGRPVSPGEVTTWLGNQRDLPVLFLSEVVRAASPTLVHSPTTAKLLSELYNVKPKVLPFAQYREMPEDISSTASRQSARKRLGLDDKEIVITSFGILAPTKGAETIVWTLKMLHLWGIPARLVFCGLGHGDTVDSVRTLAREQDIEDYIVTFERVVSETDYVDYLAGSDVGIQLREYFMGGLSGALNDCMAAGLPSIANEHLATAMCAPRLVRRVPDGLSPILIAEAVLDILQSGEHLRRPVDEMRTFRFNHSPTAYCNELTTAIGLGPLLPVSVR